jgi:hypothetical protein
VIDGNPLAATALTADDGFYRFGLLSGTTGSGLEGIRIPGGAAPGTPRLAQYLRQ